MCLATLLAMFAIVAGSSSAAESGPRPFSETERAAAEIAAHYLASGPSAIVGRLSAKSPLRTLSPDEALAEIEVRAGPNAGAKWEMQTVVPSLRDRTAVFEIEYPSGVDETLVMNLVKEGSEWKVESLRSLAEPAPYAPVVFPADATDAEKKSPVDLLPYLAALVAALIAAASAMIIRSNPVGARFISVGALVLGIGGVALAWMAVVKTADAKQEAAVVPATPGFVRLGTLLPMRRAMAAGEALAAEHRGRGDARDAARLWRAQVDLQLMRLEDVEKSLAAIALPSNLPLAELLRARVALARFDDIAACRAYERAINLGPGRDALWYEAAEALATLGFEDRSLAYLKRLPVIGSRNAVAYYGLAAQASANNDDAGAAVALTRAWRLRPAPREEIVGSPALWSAIRSSENLAGTISMSSAEEPAFRSETRLLTPISLPEGARASVTGEYLGIEIADRFLGVPGGAALVGPETPIVDALTWSRREEDAAIDDFPRISGIVGSPVALSQPSIKARLTKTAEALAARGRWADVSLLTDGLSPSAENVPLDVLMLKGVALSRTQRTDDARRLFKEVVSGPGMKRRSNPITFYQLGELMAGVELYAPAIALLERADAKLDFVSLDDRIRQISMKERLAKAYRVHASKNFEIRYPSDVSPEGAARVAEILEAELIRIRKIIPVEAFRPVTVNILWWAEFRSTFTGSDHVLGFYDGKITLPLAGVARLEPAVVALMSHELAHAVLAQATNDNAPAWLQEGLAQRIEMVPYHRNAFNMYEDDKLISVSLLDAVLTDSVDPALIGEAYIESQTLVRYIEAAHGRGGVPKLVAAYRAGAGDEAAIGQLSGKSVVEFDRAFRAWGRAATTVFENSHLIDYTANTSEKIQFSRK